MEWIKLDLRKLRSPQYIGAEPIERATWLSLLAHCADQENGGVIADCWKWGDRRWMQSCGLLLSEIAIDAQSGLWHWDGDSLVVWGYMADEEAMLAAKRAYGAKGGSAGTGSTKARSGNKNAAKNDDKRKQNASTKTQANATEKRRVYKSRVEESTREDAQSDSSDDASESLSLETFLSKAKSKGAIVRENTREDWIDLGKTYGKEAVYRALDAVGGKNWPSKIREWLEQNAEAKDQAGRNQKEKEQGRLEDEERQAHAERVIANKEITTTNACDEAEALIAKADGRTHAAVHAAVERLREAVDKRQTLKVIMFTEALESALAHDVTEPNAGDLSDYNPDPYQDTQEGEIVNEASTTDDDGAFAAIVGGRP